jgi:hypothetical protein
MSGSSIDSPFSQMVRSTVEKLQTLDWVQDENVELSDELNNLDYSDDQYPHIEVAIGSFGPDMYEGQVSLEGGVDILVRCVMKQEKDPVSGQPLKDQNLYTLVDSGSEAMSLIYSFEADKELGNPPCQGFIDIRASTQVFTEPNLDDSTMGFIFAFSTKILNLIAQG